MLSAFLPHFRRNIAPIISSTAAFPTAATTRTFAKKAKRSKKKAPPSSSSSSGNAPEISLHVKNLTKRLQGAQGRTLFEDVSLAFYQGAKIGVLGANGTGKSTLLKCVAGLDREFDGEVWSRDGLRVGYLAQEPELDEARSVHENVLDGVRHKVDLVEQFNALSEQMGEPDADFDALLEAQGKLQGEIEDLQCWDVTHDVSQAMHALSCPPAEAGTAALSGGEKRRVALARLLLQEPDILLLDEPTNHLDAASVAWLEQFLARYAGTVVAITHDRYFLDNVAGWILELDRGKALPFEGNYSAWMDAKRKRQAGQAKADGRRQKMMDRELAWARSNAKGGRGKSKARLQAFEEMRDKIQEEGQAERLEGGAIVIPQGRRLGDKVIAATGLSKAFDGRQLFDDLSFTIEPHMRVGVVGANGTGKSTLLRVLAGEREADAGQVEFGSTVDLGFVSQSRASLAPNKTAYQEVAGNDETIVLDGREVAVRAYVSAFNLKGPAQQKLVSSLSGGERNRVHLAKELRRGHNVLFLDEPTNDLDVDTLRSLEEALVSFQGCVVIVSHDRWFLNRMCTDILAFEGNGRVNFFDGNFEEYEADVQRRVAAGEEIQFALEGAGGGGGGGSSGRFKRVH